MRLPYVLTEADGHLGITNRAFAPRARRVCLALPIEGRSGARYRVTGRPVAAVTVKREEGARERLGLGPRELIVLVFGGSLGARSINEAALAGLDAAAFHVLHITGSRDWPTFAGRAHSTAYELLRATRAPCLPRSRSPRATSSSPGPAARSSRSPRTDVRRSSSPTRTPAASTRASNAAWMGEAGAAVVIEDSQLSGPRLAAEVGRLVGDPGRLVAMSRASRSLARPDAAAQSGR